MKITFSVLTTPLFLFWVATICGLSIVLCLSPMTNTLGFEYSFISGVAISLAAGHLATVHPGRIRQQKAPFPGAHAPATALFIQAMLPSIVLLVLSLTIILINGLFVPPCNTQIGLHFFLLLPLPSAIVATTVGLTIGVYFKNARSAATAWYICWALSVAYVGYQIYTTPAVFAYSPFIGYWPGVLYDKGISIDQALITYRLYNLIGVVALLLGVGIFLNLSKMQLSIKGSSFKKNGWLFVIFVTSTVLMGLFPEPLRHQTTTATLQRELPFVARAGSLKLYFDKDISPKKRHELFIDAQFSLFQIMQFWEIEQAPPIKIFVFKNAAQKKKWMGAHHTSVAKPWLGQTYIVEDQIPHLTLRHELAHLVSAASGQGPFQIAGGLGGWIPTPGLIEGVATASTPPRGDMSIHQLAKGMKELKLLPKVAQLLGIEFFRLFSRSAYTASGSFCLFFRQKFGASALKQLYGGKTAEDLTGHSLGELENQWHDLIDSVEITPRQRHEIAYRFDRPSIVSTRCVREVTRLEKLTAESAKTHQWVDALHTAEEAHLVSGESSQTEMSLLTVMANCKNTDNAADFGKKLLADNQDEVRSLQINELLIDLQLKSVPAMTLSKKYYALFQESATPHDARRLYIKSQLAKISMPQSISLLKYLSVAWRSNPPNMTIVLYDLAQISKEHPSDSLMMYLAARFLFQQDSPHRAASLFRHALGGNLHKHPAAFLVQAHFTLAQSYMKLHQYQLAKQHFLVVKKLASKELGTVALANDWLQKIEWMGSRPKS